MPCKYHEVHMRVLQDTIEQLYMRTVYYIWMPFTIAHIIRIKDMKEKSRS